MVPSCLTLQVPSWQTPVLLSHPFTDIDHLHHSDAVPSFFYSWSSTLILTLLMWLSYQAENFNCFSDMLITNHKLPQLLLAGEKKSQNNNTQKDYKSMLTSAEYSATPSEHVLFSIMLPKAMTNLWNLQCHHFYYLPVALTLLLTEKTENSVVTYLNFHFSPFKTSPPSLLSYSTVHLFSKAYLFIFLFQLPSPGHCSFHLNLFFIYEVLP